MTSRVDPYAPPSGAPHRPPNPRPPTRRRLLAGAAALVAAALVAGGCVVGPGPYGPAGYSGYGPAPYSAPPPLPQLWVPAGYVQISFGGVPYLYGDGYFHRWHDHRLVVVAPPYGAVVPVLPHGYREVHRGGRYYTYRGTYYQRGGHGWRVVPPPRWRH
jgi:hypothetical protein